MSAAQWWQLQSGVAPSPPRPLPPPSAVVAHGVTWQWRENGWWICGITWPFTPLSRAPVKGAHRMAPLVPTLPHTIPQLCPLVRNRPKDGLALACHLCDYMCTTSALRGLRPHTGGLADGAPGARPLRVITAVGFTVGPTHSSQQSATPTLCISAHPSLLPPPRCRTSHLELYV